MAFFSSIIEQLKLNFQEMAGSIFSYYIWLSICSNFIGTTHINGIRMKKGTYFLNQILIRERNRP